MVVDLKHLLLGNADQDQDIDVMNLWDDKLGLHKFGVQYHEQQSDEE